VTFGIISATGRDHLGINTYEDFIQTDAAINPGNSGGALVNLKGELIGINTAILAPAGGNVGIGFAIPINMTSQIAEQLISHGRVKRGRLGVYVQDLTPDLAQAFGTGRSQGALIAQIIPKSPAEKSGLREGDLVISINSRRIDDAADLLNAIGLLRVGQELELRVIRGGEERTIEAHIDEAEETLHEGKTLHRSLSGVLFLESEAGSGTEGVLVETVEKRSRAWNAGLRAGDLIVGVNRYRVRTLDDFSSVASGSDGLRIEFLRDGSAYYLTID
jgi:serine protease Do/serine protease DegQ